LKDSGRLAVDTNAVIAFRSGITEVCTRIRHTEMILLPAPVMGELFFGALNSGRIKENCEAVHKFLSFSTFIPINEDIAERYALVRKKLRQTGRPLPENDIWIAATCLELDIPLLTRDVHFQYVEGLNVFGWSDFSES